MDTTVDVTIPVEADVAAALTDDAEQRASVGRVVSRILRGRRDVDALSDAIARLKAGAHAAGLTDEMIDEELAAYNAERRG